MFFTIINFEKLKIHVVYLSNVILVGFEVGDIFISLVSTAYRNYIKNRQHIPYNTHDYLWAQMMGFTQPGQLGNYLQQQNNHRAELLNTRIRLGIERTNY